MFDMDWIYVAEYPYIVNCGFNYANSAATMKAKLIIWLKL